MKVAAIQMVSGVDLQANLAQAAALIAQAAQAGAELAVLPEYFCLMGQSEQDKLAMAERPGDGAVQRFLSEQARTHGLWLVGGTLPLATSDQARVHNSALVFDPQGDCVARYDKIHLFGFDTGAEHFDEARTILPGSRPVRFVLKTRAGIDWRVGLSVCYDLRFPELYRAHARSGCDLLLVPSAFTATTGRAHWEVLLRARAIENQAYVLAAAQGGRHENGRRTWGRSMVVGPWGDVLAQQVQGSAVVLADVRQTHLREVRRQLPALRHRVL